MSRIKRIALRSGIFVVYIIVLFTLSLFQEKFSDQGFIFKNYTGLHIENLIITLIFLLVCFSFGFILRVLGEVRLFFLISFYG